MTEKIKKTKTIIAITIIGMGIIISAIIASGIFDKFLIKHNFEKAFFYRTVGNCNAFIEYIATDRENWLNRCLKEKNREDTIPIKDFDVLRISHNGQDRKAFLQVQLTRGENSYTVNYEMVKEGLTWKINQEIDTK